MIQRWAACRDQSASNVVRDGVEAVTVSLADFFHRAATGPKRRRALLTPVGLAVFGASLVIVVGGGLLTDRVLQLPALLPGAYGLALGGPVLAAGAVLCGWCVIRFRKARGTPVPMNPPEKLIESGPYAWVRNPMVTGVFAGLFGVGLLFHSIGITLVWAPAYVLFHWIELRRVEEPELIQRFGDAYLEYKKRVPMFIPRFPWSR
jgi:protein-S-isoprenylcysteine O-methyltransferase Ste14